MKRTLFGFGIRFAVFFALLMLAFEASRGTAFERLVVERGIIEPAGRLFDAISPGVVIDLQRRTIMSGTARLHVTRGCEGIEMLLLLVAAILAFRAKFMRRTWGLLIGTLLVYVLTIGRLWALMLTLRYWPGGWEAMHGLLMPLAPVVLIAVFFLRWSTLDALPAYSKQQLYET